VITEVTRIMSAWARHPVHGVNAQMSFVGRQRLDGKSDPVAPSVTIYDDIDGWGGDMPDMALELDPPKVPALVVWADTDAEVEINNANYLKTGEPVIVAFAYVTRDVAGKKAKLDGGYTLRALRRCLTRFRNAPAVSKQLNGIKVLMVRTVTIAPVAGGNGPSNMWGVLAASVTVVDENP
jgi:hypothetical protein